MKNHKLKAFTLSEMLVVLVVSSILISMGYWVLNSVRKQVFLIQKSYQMKQDVQLFESLFFKDMNSYSVSYAKKLDVLTLTNTKDSIQYTFLEKTIVREKDTFLIAIKNKILFLDGKETNENEIDAIEIQLADEFSNTKLFFQKNKDAAYYINNKK